MKGFIQSINTYRISISLISSILSLFIAFSSNAFAQTQWTEVPFEELQSIDIDSCEYRLKHQDPYGIAKYFHTIYSSTNGGGVIHFGISPAQVVRDIATTTVMGYEALNSLYRDPATRPLHQYFQLSKFTVGAPEFFFATEKWQELYNSGQEFLVFEQHNIARREVYSIERRCIAQQVAENSERLDNIGDSELSTQVNANTQEIARVRSTAQQANSRAIRAYRYGYYAYRLALYLLRR
jgi:hypothetical protein